MMWRFIATCFIMALTYSLVQGADFRMADWGMHYDSVLNLETAPLSDDAGTYMKLVAVYSDSLLGHQCNVIYRFNDDSLLIGSTYSLDDESQRGYKAYLSFKRIYDELVAYLVDKYGEPSSKIRTFNILRWKQPRTRIDLSFIDLAKRSEDASCLILLSYDDASTEDSLTEFE